MLISKKILWILPTALVLVAGLAVIAFNQDDTPSNPEASIDKALNEFYSDIYKQSSPAIVSIRSVCTVRRDKTADATGFVINESGYVLTAYENVENEKEAIARYFDGSAEMVVLKADKAAGWAILKPVKEQMNRVYLKLAQNPDVKLADSCIILSNSLNSTTLTGKPALNTGEITSILTKTEQHPEMLETSFDLGNSLIGAPLLNVDGHVIGLCSGFTKAGRGLTTAVALGNFKDEIESVK